MSKIRTAIAVVCALISLPFLLASLYWTYATIMGLDPMASMNLLIAVVVSAFFVALTRVIGQSPTTE